MKREETKKKRYESPRIELFNEDDDFELLVLEEGYQVSDKTVSLNCKRPSCSSQYMGKFK